MNSTFQVPVNLAHTTHPKGYRCAPSSGRHWLSPHTTIDDVRKVNPSLENLITTCTGSGIAARAGVLGGKRPTTNRAAWNTITPIGPNVTWTSPTR
ncbi:hypothetical protein TOPH_02809 [Tolypocladium ophioglossoides CBS 100239]|uniref:Uncharacterized protein n=1 Tax=Tolypocladium ophioglossoides (strain CBS 100239) TaxID=1163406 RepID=A0A0L0NFB0_TOLOC|nr:hypothetical protein TOPH_02809 [Tolypocladium ophioglossoides CBS 100239]